MAAPSSGITGWFLPSAQQWLRMQTGLGGIAVSDITWNGEYNGECYNTDATGITAWNTAMKKAGSDYYLIKETEDDDYHYFWSSSEHNFGSAICMGARLTYHYSYSPEIKGFSWCYGGKNNNNHTVRPVLAF